MDYLVEHDFPIVDISAGNYRASVSTFGGGIRSLTYEGESLLVEYPRGVNPPLSAGTVLAPWPNRVADGVFIHRGVTHRLDISEPSRANAIHGFVANELWEVSAADAQGVRLTCAVAPRAGWPWQLTVSVTWLLDADRGLTGTFEVVNESSELCPFGLGWHPYLTVGDADLNNCTLILPVTKNLPLEPIRNLPAGPLLDVDEVTPGLAEGINLAGAWFDHCFHDDQGSTRREAKLIANDGRGVVLWADESFRWFQVYTADPARREGFPGYGRAVAVEPMTCPPDALRSGVDLIHLEPGEKRIFVVGVAEQGF